MREIPSINAKHQMKPPDNSRKHHDETGKYEMAGVDMI